MRIQTFRSFARQESKFEWLVEGLVPKGNWTFLVGAPGTGKSRLALQMVEALQEGKDFLGLKTQKTNCLYIQSDASEGEWQEQVRALAYDSRACTAYALPSAWGEDEEEVKTLREVLRGTNATVNAAIRQGQPLAFGFVVFDALKDIAHEADVNTAVAAKVLKTLKSICCTKQGDMTVMDVPFLLIHHPNKERARGPNAGAGWAGYGRDCGVSLTLASNMLRREKGRVEKNRDLELETDENGQWYLSGAKEMSRLSPVRADIRKLYPELGSV